MHLSLKFFVLSFCLILHFSHSYDIADIKYAKIETCRGCSLNRLPEVKKFVMEDAPFYGSLEVKFISGAPPELILLSDKNEELDRLPLSNLSRQECNDLLQSKGFRKEDKKEEF
ncbi:unnamed protein product [Leptidea sinapis]|uniref:Selenoprotein M n=1 Tax=Leptidea sinapis TaxID=189913 RepID=A0A5E4QNZ8_9NEOP|nr:unnamed protein product [Leptidea sinapis]